MPTDEELLLDYFDAKCGVEPKFQRLSDDDVWPPVHVATYSETPEKDLTTSFTLGLSSAEAVGCSNCRPELIICVRSNDIAWGMAIGDIAAAWRSKFDFRIGATVNFNQHISKESEMSAFLLFQSSLLSSEQSLIKLPNRTVHIIQMYPIYEGERQRIRELGVKWFLEQDFDEYDVRRRDLSR